MVNIVGCRSNKMRKKCYRFILVLIVIGFPIPSITSTKTSHRPHRYGEDDGKENESKEQIESDPHLPGNLQPEKYDLEIYTEISGSRSTHWGKVRITVKCLQNTNRVILHEKNLHIHKNDVTIESSGSNPRSLIRIWHHRYNFDHEQYIIILRDTLEEKKTYEIKIEFSRFLITQPGRGYSFNYYEREKYNEQRIAYTETENAEARRVFPCFDQTGMKAVFKIRLIHRENMNGLSNAGRISFAPAESPRLFVQDDFAETVPMETSSVAIVVTNFSTKKSTYYSTSNTDIRISADPSALKKLQAITGIATKIFQFFSNYFKVPYPFTKLDVIAVPAYARTASASYGVIFMREETLLDGIERTSYSAEYQVVSELCHAISKQWIGHTVTDSKLTDGWIHMALSIFLQTQCVTEMELKWENKFIVPDNINSYLNLFGWPIRTKHGSFLVMGLSPYYLEDVTSGKLQTAYHLTRMLHFFLGQDIFQKGINDYVEKFKYSNSKFGDLWMAFTDAANTVQPHLLPDISIRKIMISWINQKGYPLITVTRKRETKQIFISQAPFNLSEEETLTKSKRGCWLIPLSYTTKTESKSRIDTSLREWLTCEDLHLKIDMNEDDWFLLDLNVNVIGRVNYDEEIWIAIQKSLVNNEEPDVFHAFMRARLISDMFGLGERGDLSYTIVLDTMKYLPQENQYDNWALALYEFDKMRSLLLQSSVYKYFKQYVQRLLATVFQRNEYQNLTQIAGKDLDLRTAIIDASCRYGVDACRQQSLELIKKWKHGEETLNSVSEALHKTIHCQGIKYGNKKHWDSIWNLFEQETTPELKDNFLTALCCSRSTKMLKRGKFGYVHMYYTELVNKVTDKNDLEELLEFAASHVKDVSVDEDRTKAEKNVAWLRKNEKILKDYFQKNVPKRPWNLFGRS